MAATVMHLPRFPSGTSALLPWRTSGGAVTTAPVADRGTRAVADRGEALAWR
jgi:hypothetical protein